MKRAGLAAATACFITLVIASLAQANKSAASPAVARLESLDGIEVIGFAREHGLCFELFGERGKALDLAIEIVKNAFALARQLEVSVNVAGAANELFVVGNERLEPLTLAHQGLRRNRIGPHCWVGKLGFDVG